MKAQAAHAVALCLALSGTAGAAGSPEPPPAAGAPAAQADPELTILWPDGQAQLAGMVRLRADVSPPNGVEAVDFFVDGSHVCVIPAPPFECEWDAGPRAEAHVVRVAARLGGGGGWFGASSRAPARPRSSRAGPARCSFRWRSGTGGGASSTG